MKYGFYLVALICIAYGARTVILYGPHIKTLSQYGKGHLTGSTILIIIGIIIISMTRKKFK